MRGRRFIACRTAELVEPRTGLSRGVAAPHPTATGWTAAEGGGLRLRYLGWDALLAAGVPMGALGRSWPCDERIEAARVLEFRCRRLAGLDLLEARPAARVSALGGGIARGIARAAGLALGC